MLTESALNFDHFLPGTRLCVVDALGRNVFDGVAATGRMSIPVTAWAPGLLMLIISTENITRTLRFIKPN